MTNLTFVSSNETVVRVSGLGELAAVHLGGAVVTVQVIPRFFELMQLISRS